MKRIFYIIISIINIGLSAQYISPEIDLVRCTELPGSYYNSYANSIQITSDNGYIVGGYAKPAIVNNKDLLIARHNNLGDTLWVRCYGGSANEEAFSIQQTNEGGYIIVGYTESEDGDVHGHHHVKDMWIIKTNSAGDTLWTRCLGGNADDYANYVIQTYDSGYIVAGYTASLDGDVHDNHGIGDAWIVRLNSSGDTLWTKCLGGNDYDILYYIQQIENEKIILAGYTHSSNDGDVHYNHGGEDGWIVILDSLYNIDISKCFGLSDDDRALSIQQTADTGFIIAGTSLTENDIVSGWPNDWSLNYWIYKIDTAGRVEWQKYFGGNNTDIAYSIIKTNDNDYIITGITESHDGQVKGFHGDNKEDIWLLRISQTGDTLWTKCLGTSGSDIAFSTLPHDDGGYILAINSENNDGDFPEFCANYQIVRLLPDVVNIKEKYNYNIKIYPTLTSKHIFVDCKNLDHINIYDCKGLMLLTTKEKIIDLSKYTSGIYFVQLITNEGFCTTQKVIYKKY